MNTTQLHRIKTRLFPAVLALGVALGVALTLVVSGTVAPAVAYQDGFTAGVESVYKTLNQR